MNVLTDDAKVYYKEKEGIPTSIVSLKELYKRKKCYARKI